jgi:hypothetical protein
MLAHLLSTVILNLGMLFHACLRGQFLAHYPPSFPRVMSQFKIALLAPNVEDQNAISFAARQCIF